MANSKVFFDVTINGDDEECLKEDHAADATPQQILEVKSAEEQSSLATDGAEECLKDDRAAPHQILEVKSAEEQSPMATDGAEECLKEDHATPHQILEVKSAEEQSSEGELLLGGRKVYRMREIKTLGATTPTSLDRCDHTKTHFNASSKKEEGLPSAAAQCKLGRRERKITRLSPLPGRIFGRKAFYLEELSSHTKTHFNASSKKEEGLRPAAAQCKLGSNASSSHTKTHFNASSKKEEGLLPAAAQCKLGSKLSQPVYDSTFTTPYHGSEVIEQDNELVRSSLRWKNSEEQTDLAALSLEKPIFTKEFLEGDVVRILQTGTMGIVKHGHIYSVSHVERIPLKNDNVELVARYFDLGETVSRLRGNTSMIGVVMGINKRVALGCCLGSDGDLSDISTDELRSTRLAMKGDMVLYGQDWLGKVTETTVDLTVAFEDGPDGDPNPGKVVPLFNNALERAILMTYYKRQPVVWEATNLRGVVVRHQADQLAVDWKKPYPNFDGPSPGVTIDAGSVKRFMPGPFLSASWTLGKRCLFNGEEYVIKEQNPYNVAVSWESGEDEVIDSRELKAVDTPDSFFQGRFEFEIGSYVRRRGHGGEEPEIPYFGMVRRVNENGMITVSWSDDSESMVRPGDIYGYDEWEGDGQ